MASPAWDSLQHDVRYACRSLLKARVTGDGRVLELSRDKVLSLMAKDTELGEIFMEAFVARRLLMIQLGEGNVVLFGTRSSARTLALLVVLDTYDIAVGRK